MPYLCSGCGEKVIPPANKSKIICVSCGVLTDLRSQGFIINYEQENQFENKLQLDDKNINFSEKQMDNKETVHTTTDNNYTIHEKAKQVLTKLVPSDYQSSNQDDGLGYSITNANDFFCPGCGKVMESSQIICIECGYHIEKGNKVHRKHTPLNRNWIEGLDRNLRIFYATISTFCLALFAIITSQIGLIDVFSASFLVFLTSIQVSYLVGTYGMCALHRNSKGKITVSRRLWLSFIQINKKNISLEGHDGIKLIQTAHAGTIEYLILFVLLIPFIFPAIIWYFAVIEGTIFEVALTRDMGRSVDILFRSRNEIQAKEIAVLLNQITKLPLNQR